MLPIRLTVYLQAATKSEALIAADGCENFTNNQQRTAGASDVRHGPSIGHVAVGVPHKFLPALNPSANEKVDCSLLFLFIPAKSLVFLLLLRSGRYAILCLLVVS